MMMMTRKLPCTGTTYYPSPHTTRLQRHHRSNDQLLRSLQPFFPFFFFMIITTATLLLAFLPGESLATCPTTFLAEAISERTAASVDIYFIRTNVGSAADCANHCASANNNIRQQLPMMVAGSTAPPPQPRCHSAVYNHEGLTCSLSNSHPPSDCRATNHRYHTFHLNADGAAPLSLLSCIDACPETLLQSTAAPASSQPLLHRDYRYSPQAAMSPISSISGMLHSEGNNHHQQQQKQMRYRTNSRHESLPPSPPPSPPSIEQKTSGNDAQHQQQLLHPAAKTSLQNQPQRVELPESPAVVHASTSLDHPVENNPKIAASDGSKQQRAFTTQVNGSVTVVVSEQPPSTQSPPPALSPSTSGGGDGGGGVKKVRYHAEPLGLHEVWQGAESAKEAAERGGEAGKEQTRLSYEGKEDYKEKKSTRTIESSSSIVVNRTRNWKEDTELVEVEGGFVTRRRSDGAVKPQEPSKETAAPANLITAATIVPTGHGEQPSTTVAASSSSNITSAQLAHQNEQIASAAAEERRKAEAALLPIEPIVVNGRVLTHREALALLEWERTSSTTPPSSSTTTTITTPTAANASPKAFQDDHGFLNHFVLSGLSPSSANSAKRLLEGENLQGAAEEGGSSKSGGERSGKDGRESESKAKQEKTTITKNYRQSLPATAAAAHYRHHGSGSKVGGGGPVVCYRYIPQQRLHQAAYDRHENISLNDCRCLCAASWGAAGGLSAGGGDGGDRQRHRCKSLQYYHASDEQGEEGAAPQQSKFSSSSLCVLNKADHTGRYDLVFDKHTDYHYVSCESHHLLATAEMLCGGAHGKKSTTNIHSHRPNPNRSLDAMESTTSSTTNGAHTPTTSIAPVVTRSSDLRETTEKVTITPITSSKTPAATNSTTPITITPAHPSSLNSSPTSSLPSTPSSSTAPSTHVHHRAHHHHGSGVVVVPEGCFELIDGWAMNSTAGGLERDVSREECECHCANSLASARYGFQCASANYYPAERDCVLNLGSRQLMPENLVENNNQKEVSKSSSTSSSATSTDMPSVVYLGLVCPIQKAIETHPKSICRASTKKGSLQRNANQLVKGQQLGLNSDECFAEMPNYVLEGTALAVESNVSVDECKCYCVDAEGLYGGGGCRSLHYYFDSRTCLLNRESRHTDPEHFNYDSVVSAKMVHSYFDYRCHEKKSSMLAYVGGKCSHSTAASPAATTTVLQQSAAIADTTTPRTTAASSSTTESTPLTSTSSSSPSLPALNNSIDAGSSDNEVAPNGREKATEAYFYVAKQGGGESDAEGKSQKSGKVGGKKQRSGGRKKGHVAYGAKSLVVSSTTTTIPATSAAITTTIITEETTTPQTTTTTEEDADSTTTTTSPSEIPEMETEEENDEAVSSSPPPSQPKYEVDAKPSRRRKQQQHPQQDSPRLNRDHVTQTSSSSSTSITSTTLSPAEADAIPVSTSTGAVPTTTREGTTETSESTTSSSSSPAFPYPAVGPCRFSALYRTIFSGRRRIKALTVDSPAQCFAACHAERCRSANLIQTYDNGAKECELFRDSLIDYRRTDIIAFDRSAVHFDSIQCEEGGGGATNSL